MHTRTHTLTHSVLAWQGIESASLTNLDTLRHAKGSMATSEVGVCVRYRWRRGCLCHVASKLCGWCGE